MFFRSIRWQIQAWHALLLAVITTLLLVTFYRHERAARLSQIDVELQNGVISLLPIYMRIPGSPLPPRKPDFDPAERLRTSGGYFVVFDPEGNIQHRGALSPDVPRPEVIPGLPSFGRWNGPNREWMHAARWGGILVVGVPGSQIESGLRRLAVQLVLLGAAVVGVGVVVGAWIASRALRPVREITQAAREIAGGDWTRRISAKDAAVELSGLAGTLNDTFDRLERSYQQQKRFTADASHELGTPVSVILSKTQVTLAKPREAAEYAAALAVCQRAGQRMRDLTRDLLDLAEFDTGIPPARLVACDLAEIAREAVATVESIARERGGEIHEDLQPVLGHFHPVAMAQVFSNLLINAVKHNPPGVRVSVSIRQDGQQAVAEVRDQGAGLPAETLPFLFDRFFRVEAARSREKGGSGLGLAICRSIVEAHGGTIAAENAAEGGAVFRVNMPL
jgi:two-component system OmpR family sensor kinase